MKAFNFFLTLTFLMTACQKKNGSSEKDQDYTKLTDIVSQAYLDEAKEMGFIIHTGNNPPAISGKYKLAPWRFDGDNYSEPGTGTPVGNTNPTGFTLQLSEQDGTAIVVKYIGYYEGEKELSSSFILGSGNDFTICRHIQMVGGMGALFSFPYAQLISGTRDGENLRNIKMATIGLKSSSANEAGISVDGNISIRSDVDGISERVN